MGIVLVMIALAGMLAGVCGMVMLMVVIMASLPNATAPQLRVGRWLIGLALVGGIASEVMAGWLLSLGRPAAAGVVGALPMLCLLILLRMLSIASIRR